MEIKKYQPINVKKTICEQVVKNSLIEREGMLFEDNVSRELAFYISLCQFYTDMDVETLDFDEIAENGTLQYIMDSIPGSEFNFLKNTIDNMIRQEIEIHNSLAGVVARGIDKIIAKIPDQKQLNKMIPKLSKEIAKISPDTMNVLKDISAGKIK